MWRRLALGALAALPVLALVGVGPASAVNPSVSVVAPADGAIWATGADDYHVKGTARVDSSFDNVKRAEAVAESVDDPDREYVERQFYSGEAEERHFDITIRPPLNGTYKLLVYAVGQDCGAILGGCDDREVASAPAVRIVTVAAPPERPEGAKAIAAPDGVVTIEWKSNNAEPDLLGYIIERAPADGDFTCHATLAKPVTVPATYKVTDDISTFADGGYKWRVKAVRASAPGSKLGTCDKPGNGISSSTATTPTVDWVAPVTTTTTPAGGTTTTPRPTTGGTGGGGGGGTTGGGGTSSAPSAKRPNLAALGGLGVPNNLARTPRRAAEIDSGFNELLPFQPPTAPDDSGTAALNDNPLSSGTDEGNGTTTLLYIAAGLLATVLSMHVLWLKAQVDRMPLEPLPPADLPLA